MKISIVEVWLLLKGFIYVYIFFLVINSLWKFSIFIIKLLPISMQVTLNIKFNNLKNFFLLPWRLIMFSLTTRSFYCYFLYMYVLSIILFLLLILFVLVFGNIGTCYKLIGLSIVYILYSVFSKIILAKKILDIVDKKWLLTETLYKIMPVYYGFLFLYLMPLPFLILLFWKIKFSFKFYIKILGTIYKVLLKIYFFLKYYILEHFLKPIKEDIFGYDSLILNIIKEVNSVLPSREFFVFTVDIVNNNKKFFSDMYFFFSERLAKITMIPNAGLFNEFSFIHYNLLFYGFVFFLIYDGVFTLIFLTIFFTHWTEKTQNIYFKTENFLYKKYMFEYYFLYIVILLYILFILVIYYYFFMCYNYLYIGPYLAKKILLFLSF